MWKQEYRNAMELLQQDYARKIEDLENQIRRMSLHNSVCQLYIYMCFLRWYLRTAHIRGFQVQKTADDGTIKQLQEDVVVHQTHSESLSNRLKRVHFDVETQCKCPRKLILNSWNLKTCLMGTVNESAVNFVTDHHEIQDLKDCLMIEQEEKNELNKKLQNLEKECEWITEGKKISLSCMLYLIIRLICFWDF